MRALLPAALVVLTSCLFLTGLSMPDTPRPQRHPKPQVQTFTEERASRDKQQTQSSTRVKQTQDAAPKPQGKVRSLEDAEIRARHKQADRSPRTVLPSKKRH